MKSRIMQHFDLHVGLHYFSKYQFMGILIYVGEIAQEREIYFSPDIKRQD